MIQTNALYPQGILKNYVRCIAYREINTGDQLLFKPVHPHFEIYITLMINSKVSEFRPAEHMPGVPLSSSPKPDLLFSGLHTTMKGVAVYSGLAQFVSIQFHPAGFYHLFGIPPSVINECLGHVEDLFYNQFTDLHEQLHEVFTASERITLTARFLADKILKPSFRLKGASLLDSLGDLTTGGPQSSIEQMAYLNNMSIKTFERKFKLQVGIGPKQFQRVLRFSKSIGLKLYKPELNWTQIAHEMGYYDQMHLIKDFKCMIQMTPSAFLNTSPPPLESSAPANY